MLAFAIPGTTMSKTTIPTPQEQTIPSVPNLVKALLLIALLFSSFYLAVASATWLDGQGGSALWVAAIKWTVIGTLAVANVVFLIGMGVLAHDAVHRVLFRVPFWNELGGSLLSAGALIPFYANRQFHLTHHSFAHQPGRDPENVMHQHSFLVAISAGSVIALFEQYRYFFNNLRPVAGRRRIDRAVKDSLSLAVAGSVYFWAVPELLGLPLVYTVLPTLAVFPLVFGWRALSDHYAIPPIERVTRDMGPMLDVDAEAWHRDRERRQREITGWVVLTHPWLEWLWSHVNYHEVHHKYPWLSHHYLPQVFAATRDTQPYLVIKGYWRSLFNLRHRQYYATRAEMRPFLTTPDW
jgi:fatty acid desaturase